MIATICAFSSLLCWDWQTLKEDNTFYAQFIKHTQHGTGVGNKLWTELAVGLHCDIMELHVQTMVTWRGF